MRADVLIPAIERHTGRPGKRVGRNTRLICPAHDDHNPSLDVAEAPDGTALVYCRSRGCSYEAILAAVGLSDADSSNGSGGEWTPAGDALAVYPYEDETRDLLYEVCRTATKEFPQRRPDPTSKSGYRWKLESVRRVPYRLPELLEAVARKETIYVVEGEKDVERLRALGLAATCNPGGAGKWRDEYARHFGGADVVVIADRDDAGIAHARDVERSLVQVARRVLIRRARVDKPGADVSDHLAAGYALDDLAPLEEDATTPRFEIVTARSIMLRPDPPDEYVLLGSLVVRGARTIVVGDTGHGKTTLALQMLASILLGKELLGYSGAGVGPVLVLDLEQGTRSIKRTIREAGLEERDDVFYVSEPDGIALDSDEGDFSKLEDAIATTSPVALMLDPYYKAHRADDPNAERPIIDLMRKLDALRARYGFALILPAHPRKPPSNQIGTRKLTLADVAGSGAVVRGAEVVLGLERQGHGHARLRYLKDRDGDLPVGDAIGLVYSKERGFGIDRREEESEEVLQERILAGERPWMTAKEWASELGIREGVTRSMLAALAETGKIAYMVGPPGRSSKARCYSTEPEAWAQSGSVGSVQLNLVTDPTDPDSSIEELSDWEQSEEYAGGRAQSTAPSDPELASTDSPDDLFDDAF